MKLLDDRARAGATGIAVTHHLDNVAQTDKLLILGQGEVVWFGSQEEAPGHVEVHQLADSLSPSRTSRSSGCRS